MSISHPKELTQVQEWGVHAKFSSSSYLYNIELVTQDGPGYFSETFQILLKGNAKATQVSLLEIKRVSLYIVYEGCIVNANKHACVCSIASLGNRIPKEAERHEMACDLGKCS